MTPTTAPPQLLYTSAPVLRRASQAGSYVSGSGVLTPQPSFQSAPIRVLPPSSGTSTPALPVTLPAATTCPSCGNVYMPDAIFCRHCGQKREVDDMLSGAYFDTGSYAGSMTMRAAPIAGYGTPMAAEPTTLATTYASPLSISIPASNSYVPPAGCSVSASLSAPCGYETRMSSSYVPPAVQVPTTLSYQPPVMVTAPSVVRRVSGVSTPGLPGYYSLGHSISAASLSPAPVLVAAAREAPTKIMVAAPQQEQPNPEPQVPPSLTAGLPDPSSIDRQKTSYAKGLEEQLRHGTDVLAQQLKQQSDYLFSMGDQKKRQYALQVDQEIKQREMELAQQHNEQLLLLQQAAQQQKSALEHQANALLLEYNQKKAAEDLQYQQYEFQKRQYETQLQYNEEMKDLQVQQAAASAQVAHQKVAIAQQAVLATHQAAQTAAQAQQASRTSQATAGHKGMMAANSYGPAPPTSYSMSLPTYVPGTPPQVSSSFLPAPATNLQVAPTNYGSSYTANPSAYWSAGNADR
eukprot:CAMPEP_0197664442 /NCGR_PEP_ID=MMETSP1338-20131121/58633_1 /TAXON_ID=43686 ORGANISM="Pelagodinium beii, Strain RCC1491" /NCGR_SAMPLE_ID=MMETSP1338 /ASSEMBLY_ACC=CAM_ASM_000754 /LENGTH=518 /DNA_ID=CAMNT_0043243073 /DNA_START=81 /DNA_END=1637 /DNA_ORIENTATION=+